MMVDVASARYHSAVARAVVYFCCGGCKQAFDAHPERYEAARS
jgi:YHS domain-containing protein